jgi:hypothetical protein
MEAGYQAQTASKPTANSLVDFSLHYFAAAYPKRLAAD